MISASSESDFESDVENEVAVFDDYEENGHRNLKPKPPDYCADFKFEYSIDGKVTSLNKGEYQRRSAHIQRVVEVIKLSEDPNITGGEEKEVEVAFRMSGCPNSGGDAKTFQLTHIYWA